MRQKGGVGGENVGANMRFVGVLLDAVAKHVHLTKIFLGSGVSIFHC